jgi:hypothetical protein
MSVCTLVESLTACRWRSIFDCRLAVIGRMESRRCFVIVFVMSCLRLSSISSVMREATARIGFAVVAAIVGLCTTSAKRVLARVSREIPDLASSVFETAGLRAFMVVWICARGWVGVMELAAFSRLRFIITIGVREFLCSRGEYNGVWRGNYFGLLVDPLDVRSDFVVVSVRSIFHWRRVMVPASMTSAAASSELTGSICIRMFRVAMELCDMVSTHRGYFTNAIMSLVGKNVFPYQVALVLPDAGYLPSNAIREAQNRMETLTYTNGNKAHAKGSE